jgi:hypothetical protein
LLAREEGQARYQAKPLVFTLDATSFLPADKADMALFSKD